MADILADDAGESLASEFEAAANDPASFDFSFSAQREATGFANFGFDPVRAAAMRAADPSNDEDEDEEDTDWDEDEDDDYGY